jgi:hypothetical protein
MLKHGDLLDKTRSPSPKSRSGVFANPPVPLFPNTPASNDDNLSETGTQKGSFGIRESFKSAPRDPWNLQIIPYASTESAIEEQMPPIF